MTSCMRSSRVFDNPDALIDMFLSAVLFRLADGTAIPTDEAGAAETVALLRNLRRTSSDMLSPFTSPLLLTPLLAQYCSLNQFWSILSGGRAEYPLWLARWPVCLSEAASPITSVLESSVEQFLAKRSIRFWPRLVRPASGRENCRRVWWCIT